MKKAFTLIELLVTLVLAVIFFQFLLQYKLNFMNELQDLRRENQLVKDNYRLSQILTKGFSYQNNYYPPIIALEKYNDGVLLGFESHYEAPLFLGTANVDTGFWVNNETSIPSLTISQSQNVFFNVRTYQYDKHSFFNSITLLKAEDDDGVDGIYRLRYSISHKNNNDIKLEHYTKLVYTK